MTRLLVCTMTLRHRYLHVTMYPTCTCTKYNIINVVCSVSFSITTIARLVTIATMTLSNRHTYLLTSLGKCMCYVFCLHSHASRYYTIFYYSIPASTLYWPAWTMVNVSCSVITPKAKRAKCVFCTTVSNVITWNLETIHRRLRVWSFSWSMASHCHGRVLCSSFTSDSADE